MSGSTSERPWIGTLAVAALALAVSLPTVGDFGLTWDEPAYRYSQQTSAEWWALLASSRSLGDLDAALEPDTLLYHWPYGRHGINFHPPLAGQLNLLTYGLFGSWVRDIPARRLASVFEFVVAVAALYHFLGRRYSRWVGLIASGALLTMPRVYGDSHIAGTDIPGLTLWTLAALAAWKGLNEPGAARSRAAVGLLVGLAFLVKMAAVMVLLPIVGWLIVARLPRSFGRGGRACWIDGVLTTLALLAPTSLAFLEIRRLAGLLPPPNVTNLFDVELPSRLPGAILLAPLAIWIGRRLLGRLLSRSKVWGVERPGLEIWEAILAFGPAVAWLGNPSWWREALPRLAHYYMLSVGREGALPDIRIFYLGETYLFSLPWHNGWVMIAATVPALTLVAAALGIGYALGVVRRDRLPLYFVAHFATLPALRMLPTPAHDGVRLMLPCFVFLAGLAGWGAVATADALAAFSRRRASPGPFRATIAAAVVGWSTLQLILIHPYELSYYNRFVGGPTGAHWRGFELSYWYDAFNPAALDAINEALPNGAAVVPTNEYSQVPTFNELQSLGLLRADLRLGESPEDAFPFVWLLAHDSKANAYSRLLFAMAPALEVRPQPLGGLRVAGIAGPDDAARAWALQLLAADSRRPPPEPRAPIPEPLRDLAPWLARFWGEGLTRPPRPTTLEPAFDWAASDPEGLVEAAHALAEGRDLERPGPRRLRAILERFDSPGRSFADDLFRRRPIALVEAVDLLIRRPEAVRHVLSRPGYTMPEEIGGPLEPDAPEPGRRPLGPVPRRRGD